MRQTMDSVLCGLARGNRHRVKLNRSCAKADAVPSAATVTQEAPKKCRLRVQTP
jgi:hypothetical protein